MRILALTKYGRLGASSRMRFIQYFSYLEKNKVQIDHYPLTTDEMLQQRYRVGNYNFLKVFSSYCKRIKLLAFKKRKYDLIWVQGEAFPFFPVSLELFLLRGSKYIVDYDDAIFHRYDMSKRWFIRYSLGMRIDLIMKNAALVVSGNEYIAKRAIKAGAPNIETLPTVIDLNRYNNKKKSSTLPIIGWVGSPTTSKYLTSIESALVKLNNEIPFELWVVGGDYSNDNLNVKLINWSEETEAESIQNFDVGIMPLFDSPWERGKCGYKLIQYMASAKPVVGSSMGVNKKIILESYSGFTADNEQEWIIALKKLLTNNNLSKTMGGSGRLAVEANYCLQAVAPNLLSLFRTLDKK